MKNGRYVDGNGSIKWYRDGKLYREDGPSCIESAGSKEWWVDDVQLTEEEFHHWLKKTAPNENLNFSLPSLPTIMRGKI